MYGEQNNLKDTTNQGQETSLAISDTISVLSYKKTNKLTAALFMVTDIMEKDEPIRLKLRTLGVEVLSDTTSMSRSNLDIRTGGNSIKKKIQEVLHFLEIAEMVNLISKMNLRVLKSEFLKLQESLDSHLETLNNFAGQATLSEFFHTQEKFSITPPIQPEKYSIGQFNPTRIGVQKGSTLMKALSDRMSNISATKTPPKKTENNPIGHPSKSDFKLLKKDRRNQILTIIKDNKGEASITDIKSKIKGDASSSSEKTLQRELVSMVTDGVLEKNGSKRWSRYLLPKQ